MAIDKKRRFWGIVYASLAICGAIFLVIIQKPLRQNQQDPFWLQLDTILICNDIVDGYSDELIKEAKSKSSKYKINILENNLDYLEQRYLKLHVKDTNAAPIIPQITEPFIPTWNIKKVDLIFDTLEKKKKIVINGVTGTGKSTFVNSTAEILAGNPERIHKLQCVQKMEIEYHKRWIGEYIGNKFVPGKLLHLLEEAKLNPEKNYVLILDDFDKIPSPTFFGSEIWSELNEPKEKTFIDGYDKEIFFPNNIYIISVIHIGESNVYQFTNEHIRRLGYFYNIPPDYEELLLYCKAKAEQDSLSAATIKNVLYSFVKINEFIEKQEAYGRDMTLGQWSTLRKHITDDKFDAFYNVFVQHINSLSKQHKLSAKALEDIKTTVKNDGFVPKTNPLYKLYQNLLATGLFAELSAAVAFAILSALFGWFFIFKKRILIKKIQDNVYQTVEGHNNDKQATDETLSELFKIRRSISTLIHRRKIKHDEAVYLMLFIDEQVKHISEIEEKKDITSKLLIQLYDFMKDGVLDDKEYRILNDFLENIKDSISLELYYQLRDEIDGSKNK